MLAEKIKAVVLRYILVNHLYNHHITKHTHKTQNDNLTLPDSLCAAYVAFPPPRRTHTTWTWTWTWTWCRVQSAENQSESFSFKMTRLKCTVALPPGEVATKVGYFGVKFARKVGAREGVLPDLHEREVALERSRPASLVQ